MLRESPLRQDVITQVQAAYRFILGREADEGGLDTYYGLITEGRLDYQGLRRLMLDSTEYAASAVKYQIVDMPHGLKVVVDAQDPEFGRAITSDGTWEPHIVDAIRTSLRPGDSFIDIGANVGVMSFNAADVVGPAGKVASFEPNPRNVSAFRRGLVANGFAHVTLYPLALSDHRHMITVSSSSNGKVLGDATVTQAQDVIQAVTLDEMLAGSDRVNVIKIDIEGWELPALRGASDILARHQPLVLCEFNPLCLREQGGIDAAELASFIFERAAAVDLVEHDKSRTTVKSASDLMALWHERDAYHTQRADLPAGWVHFDLLFKAGR